MRSLDQDNMIHFLRRSLLIFLVLAAPCRAATAPEGLFGDMFISSPAALPCQRKLPLWPNARTLSVGNWSMQLLPTTNAARVIIKHAPIPGVTPEMMVWLFSNLNRLVADPRGPQGKEQRYQVYVLMHPVDNVSFNYSSPVLHMNATDPTKGTAWQMAHFYAASCKADYSGVAKGPWVTCPTGSSREPFTCHTPQQKLTSTPSSNTSNYYAQRLDKKGFSAVATLGVLEILRVVYTWQETSSGLQITQDVVFGVNEPAAASLNPQGLQEMVGRGTMGDTTLGLAKLVLHEIEIVGWYPQWLPAVHKAETAAGSSSNSSSTHTPNARKL